jgi:hypothetical protein
VCMWRLWTGVVRGGWSWRISVLFVCVYCWEGSSGVAVLLPLPSVLLSFFFVWCWREVRAGGGVWGGLVRNGTKKSSILLVTCASSFVSSFFFFIAVFAASW